MWKESCFKLPFTSVLALTRSLEKSLCNSLALLKMVAYLSQENTKVLVRSLLLCHCIRLQPELDALPSIVYCFRPKTLFLISPNFSFVRLKVASAKHLLDPKYLSQNTSTLSDTGAHKYPFQCYSLIFIFKSRVSSLESTTQLSNTNFVALLMVFINTEGFVYKSVKTKTSYRFLRKYCDSGLYETT